MVFGSWTVIRRLQKKTKAREARYACRCRCGNLLVVNSYRLKNLAYSVCNRCKKRKHHGIDADWQSTHVGHVYGYMLKLEREQGLEMYEPWRDFGTFMAFYCIHTHTPPDVALSKPTTWSYYKMERVDTTINFSPDNISFRKFVTERARDEFTRRYWRRLGSRELLSAELKDSYILFINTFGLRPQKHKLIRHDDTKPIGKGNGEWVPFGRGIPVK